jgi:hypothetical protein
MKKLFFTQLGSYSIQMFSLRLKEPLPPVPCQLNYGGEFGNGLGDGLQREVPLTACIPTSRNATACDGDIFLPSLSFVS